MTYSGEGGWDDIAFNAVRNSFTGDLFPRDGVSKL